MVNKKILVNFWDVLNLTTDYLKTGNQSRHSQLEILPDTLEQVHKEITLCTKCRLCELKINTVPGKGTENPTLMIIAEGLRSVDKEYLDKWMEAIGLSREKDLFITDIIKCKLSENRKPLHGEMSACFFYLERQMRLLKPCLILSLGEISSNFLTGNNEDMDRLRGKTYDCIGTALIPTYHPRVVLENPSVYRKLVWGDLKRVSMYLDEH